MKCRKGSAGVALAAALFAALPAYGVDAASIAWHASRGDGEVAIEASAIVDADVATVWRVLTDYAHYTQFIPDVRKSRVVSRQGSMVVVQQAIDASWGLVRAPVDLTYEITEDAPYGLVSHATGDCTCTLDSRYRLTAAGSLVRLDYRGRLALDGGVLAFAERAAGERTAARQFHALVEEIEKRADGGVASRPASHRAQ